MPDRDFTFVIEEHLGVLSRSDNGWTRELNIVSWNGQKPKYDIRDWDPDHERMSKGVTLLDRDMKLIVDLYLKDRNRRVVQKAQEEKAAREKRHRDGPHSRWTPEEARSQSAEEAAEAETMAYLAGDGEEKPEEMPAAKVAEGSALPEEIVPLSMAADTADAGIHDETPF